jgi:MFS family permease
MPTSAGTGRLFYGWWIAAAAFLNLFFTTGIIYYGFPVFYPAFMSALGFTRAQMTQGFLIGSLLVGLPLGLLAGVLIDKLGARIVILIGVGFVGLPLILMGSMSRFWQYELLCIAEVVGYALAGPIANQVLIAQWFQVKRGRAMGYAYLGLGLGGVAAPPLADLMIRSLGWRSALHVIGASMLLVLFPVGLWITRSRPGDIGLHPDGCLTQGPPVAAIRSPGEVASAVRTGNFWLILFGAVCILGSVNVVIQHFILYLKDHTYGTAEASHLLSWLLISSLAGRVVVGHVADRFRKKNTMALSYLLLGASLPLLHFVRNPAAAWAFTLIFGFSMGADYMLIPLVTAECFGVESLGKLLALIIMGYSIAQWMAPWLAGKVFDRYHSYGLVWNVLTCAGVVGAASIYAISSRGRRDPGLGTAELRVEAS